MNPANPWHSTSSTDILGIVHKTCGNHHRVVRGMDVHTLACSIFNVFVNPLGILTYALPRTLDTRYTRECVLFKLFPEDPRKVKYVAFNGYIVSVKTFSDLPSSVQVAWDAACEKGLVGF